MSEMTNSQIQVIEDCKNKQIGSAKFSIIDDYVIPSAKQAEEQTFGKDQYIQKNGNVREKSQTVYSSPGCKLYKVEDVPDHPQQQPQNKFTKKQTPKSVYIKGHKQQQQSTNSPSKTQPSQITEQPINPEQSLFSVSKQAYVDCMKAIFIMTEIMDPIEADKLLNLEQEQHVEFMFLVAVRAHNYLKSVQSILSKLKQKNSTLKGIAEDVSAYYQKAKSKFKIYSQIMDDIRGRLGQKISRLFHVAKTVNGKQLFLDGFEGIDYEAEDQIQFTHRNYIQIVLNSKQIKNPYFKNHRLKKVLKGYKQFCEISGEDIQSQREFKSMMDEIIIDQ